MPKFYGEIAKTETQDDGSIKVWGYASTETQDSDGETITATAMKAAIPDYMKFGAVREMHNPQTAAGTALEIRVEDDGKTWFGAHIVDSEAVKKVQAGVYKGFSIGGSVTARDQLNKTVITGLKLTEISLVDRPANPDAVLTCFKAAKSDTDNEAENTDDDDESQSQPQKPKSADDEQKDDAEKNDETEKTASSEPIQKSMWQVKNLAGLLSEVKFFITDIEWEKNQPVEVITDARAAATLLASALQKLVVHETADLLSAADEPNATSEINKVARPSELEKALGAAGFDKNDDPAECIAKMHQRITELEKQPEPPKVHLHAISKTDDSGSLKENHELNGFEPIVKQDGSLDEVATLIKAAQTGKLS